MSISSAISGFLDKIVEARFKRDGQGRLVFFPWGFGRGRIVTNATDEARLRKGCRRLTIFLFVVIIPIIAAFNGIYQLKGTMFVAFFLLATLSGFVLQLYPVWLARDLPRSTERMSYASVTASSLDRFGRGFKIFGLVTSLVFCAIAAIVLLVPAARAGSDPVAMTICLVVFAPMAVLYAAALRRGTRRRTG